MISPEGDQLRELVQPFLIDRTQLRGRSIRMGPVLDYILTRHPYPPAVARLLGETVILAVSLASALKFDGIFTLQATGNGPVSILLADVAVGTGTAPPGTREVRGYARIDRDRLSKVAPNPAEDGLGLRDLMGKGLLAFTVDQGEYTDRYQGIVELSGDTLTDCVQAYFRQSEQLDSGIRLAVGIGPRGDWRGGAIMIQRLPETTRINSNTEVDAWRHTMMLLGTCTDGELLDPELPANDLLFRLFHEDGVRVFDPGPIVAGCRCTVDRLERVLRSLPRAELADVETEDGRIEMTCDFCNKTFRFGREQLDALHAG